MKLGLSGLYEALYLYKWDCTANYANYPNSLVCPIHCPAWRPVPEFQPLLYVAIFYGNKAIVGAVIRAIVDW